MTELSEKKISHEVSNPESTIKEIQTDRIIYEISSSTDTKKTIDKMRKNVEAISKSMEYARRKAYEKRLESDESKILLAEKRAEIKKIRQELERAKSHVLSAAKKALGLEDETNKVKLAIDKIRESTEEIDPKYIEKAQTELTNMFVKLKYETEKAQSDLNASKELESLTENKLQDAESEFNKLEASTLDRISESDRIMFNVTNTITHIAKSYDEMTSASKDLLKSAIQIRAEVEELDKQEEYSSEYEGQNYRIPI